MDACTFPDIEAEFDRSVSRVAARQGIDPICSTSDWIVPAASAFAPHSEPQVYASESGYLALLAHESPRGTVLSSFDAVWGFASPLVGDDPSALVDQVQALLPSLNFYALSLSGIDPAGPLFEELERLQPVGYTTTADRCVADLRQGFESWLGRRSPRFRRSLRAAVARGEAAGITMEYLQPATPTEAAEAFERVLAIEKTSWKTDAESGLINTDLGMFTRAMCLRFAAQRGLRVQFARLDGEDVGYVVGARVGDRYRGFQHSFNQHHRDLSIGKFMQFNTIAALTNEGTCSYDMGMHMDYKDSYCDRLESTITVIVAGSQPQPAAPNVD